MSSSRYTPVVVGVGDIVNRSQRIEDAHEPFKLILQAVQAAILDSHAKVPETLSSRIDSIDVVACWTWPYEDLPGLLASELKVEPRHKFCPSYHGGNQPGKLFDDAARRISLGESKVALVCGGEALASLGACAKAGKLPPPGWTKVAKDVDSVFSPTTRDLATGLGKPHAIGAPIHVYPLYENGFRAHRNQSIPANNEESAKLYADFAKVAEGQQYAWNYGRSAESEEDIGTVSRRNRMICFPYPLLMNAFNNVNLAAACLLTSTHLAIQLGIPRERWIYPLGGAGTRDSNDFWERPNYYTSPSISRSLDACLQVSELHRDAIDLFDFYSCFPIVPKIACQYLGLSVTEPEKPITLLGGLTSFGGAGNNYSMHALTEMVRRLRNGDGNTGLVLANGGVMTYQHAVCLSTRPRQNPYPDKNPLPEVLNCDDAPEAVSKASGEAIIETYTVEFDRKGQPVRGHIVGRLQDSNTRFLANHGDQWTLSQLCSMRQEPIGRQGCVAPDLENEGRNLFHIHKNTSL